MNQIELFMGSLFAARVPLRYSQPLRFYHALSNLIYFTTFLDVCLSQLSIIHLAHLLRLLLIALGYHLQLLLLPLLLLLECYGEIHTLTELRSAANFGHLPISMENCLQLLLLINKRSWTLGSLYKSSMIDIRWHKTNIDNEYSLAAFPHSLTSTHLGLFVYDLLDVSRYLCQTSIRAHSPLSLHYTSIL